MKINLSRKLKIMLSTLTLIAIFINVSTFRDHLKDKHGSTAANIVTEKYRTSFPLGTSMSDVRAKLETARVPTLVRGDDFVLAIAQEGATPWYCNHKYWGSAFKFHDGSLVTLTSDEVLDECL